MKILWYVNIVMPRAAQHFNLKISSAGGWLVGQAEAVKDKVKLYIVALSTKTSELQQAQIDGINYIVLPSKGDCIDAFTTVLKAVSPDIVHVFGTEYSCNTQIINLCTSINQKNVVSLQGIIALYAKEYDTGLPEYLKHTPFYIRLMKKLYYAQGVAQEKHEFFIQGQKEIEALTLTENVIGRTDFDKQFALSVNKNINYYHVNENLRDEFYKEPAWQYNACEKHSIFVSQASYPIKGFHQLLKIMPRLAEIYPDLKVYVAGTRFYSLNNKLLDCAVDMFFQYQKYLKKQIKKLKLESYIVFTGPLNAVQMKERYLKANVFLSCSAIENSPNSLGEAMLLGVPAVSSDRGGVPSMLTDKRDGLLYDFYDTDKMLECISEMFDNKDKAEFYAANAREHAKITHDRQANTAQLMKVYQTIMQGE